MTMRLLDGALRPDAAAALVLGGAGFALAAAWFIEIVLGVKPCPLCLEQRIPYYVGLPLAAAGLAVALRAPRSRAIGVLLALVSIAFVVGSAMGLHHAGVEAGWWKGPQDCAGTTAAPPAAIQDFLKELSTVKVIRCDEVAMRIFGLSLAAWNAIVSGAAGFFAAAAALRAFLAQGSSSVSQ